MGLYAHRHSSCPKQLNVSAVGRRIGRLYRLKNVNGMDWDYAVLGVQMDLATGDDVELDDLDPWSKEDESFLNQEIYRVKSGAPLSQLSYLDTSQQALRIYNIAQDFQTFGSDEKDHYEPYADRAQPMSYLYGEWRANY